MKRHTADAHWHALVYGSGSIDVIEEKLYLRVRNQAHPALADDVLEVVRAGGAHADWARGVAAWRGGEGGGGGG